jgi:hypothetical protein
MDSSGLKENGRLHTVFPTSFSMETYRQADALFTHAVFLIVSPRNTSSFGTMKDNTKDMLLKNRHNCEKLSIDQVEEIRKREAGPSFLARKFNVCRDTVSAALNNRTYCHITTDELRTPIHS